ncbi:hypothetical protein IC620_15645 [Hazenella sp. IB182357]|uniref:Uncharacterized protein n=1 Tax=Polycladospora coralii TaxID=2771432 RepID=A0A926NHS7_9BACL|nr:hypothetical protein [Polycladospora coralii]MBD1373779.1 hypothetical protein [Polycladospora coralii]MBS7531851.1 hypothetical protein [Polycladospora coralii]
MSDNLLQQILNELKELKTDVKELKTDVKELKIDMQDVKADINKLDQKVNLLGQDVQDDVIRVLKRIDHNNDSELEHRIDVHEAQLVDHKAVMDTLSVRSIKLETDVRKLKKAE